MAETVSYDPGAKIAQYRKQTKMSAEELAERAGFGLTRSIVANIENGRKGDVTVRQLMAIAFVLDVSPVDLLFDLTKPYKRMVVTNGEAYESVAAVWLLRDWFGGSINRMQLNATVNGEPADDSKHPSVTESLMQGALRRRSALLEALEVAETELAEARAEFGEEPTHPDLSRVAALNDRLQVIRADLYTTENALRTNGADLDNPVHPGLPF